MKRFAPLALLALVACSHTPPEITQAEAALLADPPATVRAEVEAKLPGTLAEIDALEAEVLAAGRVLSAEEIALATRLGVAHPERVRVLVRPRSPGAVLAGLVTGGVTGGLTTGYGITLYGMDERWLVAHELVHVSQFEALGREAMIRRYLTELAVLPDNLIPLEREAIARSEAVAGPNGTYAF